MLFLSSLIQFKLEWLKELKEEEITARAGGCSYDGLRAPALTLPAKPRLMLSYGFFTFARMPDLNSFGPLLTVVGLALTVAGLVLTVGGVFSARRQTRDLARMAADLAVVGERLSTRYLGEAPDYYPEVKGVVDRAKTDLQVSCTLPAIGFFNYYEAWLGLKSALESASLRIKVRCVFGTSESQLHLLREQFREARSDWDSWRANAENAAKLDKFRHRFGNDTDITTPEALFSTMAAALNEIRKATYYDADVIETASRMRMFAWVADSKEAVFVIPAFAPKYVAYAFWTRDSRLINALVTNHQEHRELDQRQTPGANK